MKLLMYIHHRLAFVTTEQYKYVLIWHNVECKSSHISALLIEIVVSVNKEKHLVRGNQMY